MLGLDAFCIRYLSFKVASTIPACTIPFKTWADAKVVQVLQVLIIYHKTIVAQHVNVLPASHTAPTRMHLHQMTSPLAKCSSLTTKRTMWPRHELKKTELVTQL
jgi:hypothetical protein